jgi:NAD(P)-dependent dehydrogenase (short-subunit alcohol dehydrogenase family)
MDLTNRGQYIAAADKAEKHWGGPPQLLIQTAGVNTFGPAEASTFEDYDWVLGVNLNGVVNGMVIFVPRLIKANNIHNGAISKGGGHIGIVSSMGAFDGFSTDAPYSVSKAAVNNLAFSIIEALKPYGIRRHGSCVRPTSTPTSAKPSRRDRRTCRTPATTHPRVR